MPKAGAINVREYSSKAGGTPLDTKDAAKLAQTVIEAGEKYNKPIRAWVPAITTAKAPKGVNEVTASELRELEAASDSDLICIIAEGSGKFDRGQPKMHFYVQNDDFEAEQYQTVNI